MHNQVEDIQCQLKSRSNSHPWPRFVLLSHRLILMMLLLPLIGITVKSINNSRKSGYRMSYLFGVVPLLDLLLLLLLPSTRLSAHHQPSHHHHHRRHPPPPRTVPWVLSSYYPRAVPKRHSFDENLLYKLY